MQAKSNFNSCPYRIESEQIYVINPFLAKKVVEPYLVIGITRTSEVLEIFLKAAEEEVEKVLKDLSQDPQKMLKNLHIFLKELTRLEMTLVYYQEENKEEAKQEEESLDV